MLEDVSKAEAHDGAVDPRSEGRDAPVGVQPPMLEDIPRDPLLWAPEVDVLGPCDQVLASELFLGPTGCMDMTMLAIGIECAAPLDGVITPGVSALGGMTA